MSNVADLEQVLAQAAFYSSKLNEALRQVDELKALAEKPKVERKPKVEVDVDYTIPLPTKEIVCRHGYICKLRPKGECRFGHPDGRHAAVKLVPVCKWGPECNRRDTNCPYVHMTKEELYARATIRAMKKKKETESESETEEAAAAAVATVDATVDAE